MKELPHTHSCFVCGETNPRGLKLRFHTDGRVVTARFKPCPEHIGFKGVVHGGITATVLDEMMAWACGVGAQTFAYCAELTVRYLQPIAPSQELVARGELVENRRRLLICKAEVLDAAGTVLAEATGKYIPLRGPLHDAMLADFLSDPSVIFGK